MVEIKVALLYSMHPIDPECLQLFDQKLRMDNGHSTELLSGSGREGVLTHVINLPKSFRPRNDTSTSPASALKSIERNDKLMRIRLYIVPALGLVSVV